VREYASDMSLSIVLEHNSTFYTVILDFNVIFFLISFHEF